MIGSIGFFVASLAFLAYGLTSYRLASHKKSFDRKSYLIAYILVAGACISWGIGIHLEQILLNNAVILGDCLLLGATIALLSTSAKKSEKLPAIISGVFVFSLLIWVRLLSFTKNPEVINGVLVFNTPRLFGGLMSIAILIVWVRTNMYYFTEIIDKKLQSFLRPSYFSMNILSFISVTGFLFARKNLTIIVSFSMLVFCFIILSLLNYYILHQKGASHGKR